MAAKWILKLTPEESKFIEGVAVEYVDKVLSCTERDNCVNLLNHIGHSKWGLSKFKIAMSACRKQLGIKGKKGFDKGTKVPRKHPDETKLPAESETLLEGGEILQEWERKLLNYVGGIVTKFTKALKEENDRLRKERDETRLELRSLVKIKQAVEEIQDNHRKRG